MEIYKGLCTLISPLIPCRRYVMMQVIFHSYAGWPYSTAAVLRDYGFFHSSSSVAFLLVELASSF